MTKQDKIKRLQRRKRPETPKEPPRDTAREILDRRGLSFTSRIGSPFRPTPITISTTTYPRNLCLIAA